MTHVPINLPFKGFTEQSAFSAVPQGMTPSCLNMMPSDVWNGRTRISTRNGTRLYNDGGIQFMGSYRIFESGKFVEKIIFVRAGKVYYADPRSSLTATETLFGDLTTQATALLNATGLVEGVQFNEHFYFVDGDHYVFVRLTTPSAANAVAVWGATTPNHGPFRTDPTSVAAGERATLICRWGARLVLAGYKRTPNVWFACAPDEPYPHTSGGSPPPDGWTGSDILGAVSGTAYADYGTLGDPIVSIFPFAQTGLMFACTNSFSFLTTDPVFGDNASMVALTRSIGIAGRRAWCQSQEKGAWILANDGLYFINANDFNFNRASRVSAGRLDSFFLRLDFGTPATGGTGPFSGGTTKNDGTDTGDPDSGPIGGSGAKVSVFDVAQNALVDELAATSFGVDPFGSPLLGGALDEGQVFPCLCYDPDREGVWMFLSVGGVESASLHLYYDLKTDSFWPQRFSDPKIYAPISAAYIGASRTDSGRLFMGGSQSISIIERSFPIGIDGWNEEMSDGDQRKQFMRSSLTLGPIMGQIPYKAFLSEVRVDLADDDYELPSGFTDLSNEPSLSVSTGDTAQTALGIQTDSLFVTNLNPLVLDGGNAAAAGTVTYNGGDKTAPSPNIADGRFSHRPFGQYTQDDPFASGKARVYNGPAYWKLKWDPSPTDAWVIYRSVNEYEQVVPDPATPDGVMVTLHQNPVSPDVKDNASVSGASFPDAAVTEIGILTNGRNPAFKCRIRSEAMYLTIASDGRPWSIERMSAVVSQVGKSRGGS